MQKSCRKNLSFKSALFIRAVLTNTIHSTNVLLWRNSIFFAYKHTIQNSSFHSDEGPTPQTSTLETLYCDQVILSTRVIKPNYLVV